MGRVRPIIETVVFDTRYRLFWWKCFVPLARVSVPLIPDTLRPGLFCQLYGDRVSGYLDWVWLNHATQNIVNHVSQRRSRNDM